MKWLMMLLLSLPMMGQSLPIGGIPVGSSYPAITVGIHGNHDNGASSATTVVQSGSDWASSNATPTAGSTIYCDVKTPNTGAAYYISVADNVNSGNYFPAVAGFREPNHNYQYSSFYKENVAASATTITATFGNGSGGTHAQIACAEIKGAPATYAADTSIVQSRQTASTNPSNPNSYTPYNNNEIVWSGLTWDAGSLTAGTNYTLLDSASALAHEYWIQTTKTATTGAFADSSSSDYGIGMFAFGQNHAGTCGVSGVIDWNGGTNGGTPAAADLQASTWGMQAQPSAEISYNPGWVVGGSGGTTYNTAAYQALANSVTCPFYSGSGTGTNTLGLDHAGGGGTASPQLYFYTSASTVTLGACMSTTATAVTSKSLDAIAIHGGDIVGNTDYVNLQWNGSGNKWAIETHSGTVNSTNTWSTGQQYWILLKYVQAGVHTISIYTGCGNNPTLLETMTAPGSTSGGGAADIFNFAYAGNDTWSTGHWYTGAVKMDILYGSTLLP